MNNEEDHVLPEYLKFCLKDYEIYNTIGEGTFSAVYRAKCLRTGQTVALKAITKTSAPDRIYEELNILKELDGQKNCIKLLNVLRNEDQVIAVFPLIESVDFKDFIIKCSTGDIQNYLYNLILAISHVHSKGIIHRDIKPSNFIYSLESERGYLIDFGLAQVQKVRTQEAVKPQTPVLFFNSIVTASKPPGYYERDTRPVMRASRAGTRGFRAPEVLFKCTNQTKSIDMWSVGVILLCILTAQYPFFLSTEDIDGLVEIAIIFGHAEMRKAARYYGRTWKSNISSIGEEKIQFSELIKKLNPNSDIDSRAVDLLNNLLELISENRISAENALKHSFFKK